MQFCFNHLLLRSLLFPFLLYCVFGRILRCKPPHVNPAPVPSRDGDYSDSKCKPHRRSSLLPMLGNWKCIPIIPVHRFFFLSCSSFCVVGSFPGWDAAEQQGPDCVLPRARLPAGPQGGGRAERRGPQGCLGRVRSREKGKEIKNMSTFLLYNVIRTQWKCDQVQTNRRMQYKIKETRP